MTAFAGQNRPTAADTAAVKSAAVVFLPIAIVIIATPPRSLRQAAFNHPVNDFDSEFTMAGEIAFSGQRNVAPLGCAELPIHFLIACQVLPAIASADVTD